MRKSLLYTAVGIAVILAILFAWHVLNLGPISKNPISSSSLTQIPAAIPTQSPISVPPQMFHYIEIIDGCGPYYNGGACVNMRSGPGTNFPVVAHLRTGMVLKVEDTIFPNATLQKDPHTWYKIVFDGEIRYPERVKGNWYVAVDDASIKSFENPGDSELAPGAIATTTKHITVDLSKQMLYAYEGKTLFMQESVSTGLLGTRTPRGIFPIYKKTPSRYMQGPIPGISDQYYDLPGVPWNLYFTHEGAVVHGAYWHDHFGEMWSHGCVNLPPEKAEILYNWADLGTPVLVQD